MDKEVNSRCVSNISPCCKPKTKIKYFDRIGFDICEACFDCLSEDVEGDNWDNLKDITT